MEKNHDLCHKRSMSDRGPVYLHVHIVLASVADQALASDGWILQVKFAETV